MSQNIHHKIYITKVHNFIILLLTYPTVKFYSVQEKYKHLFSRKNILHCLKKT